MGVPAYAIGGASLLAFAQRMYQEALEQTDETHAINILQRITWNTMAINILPQMIT